MDKQEYSPNIFLFQTYLGEILREGKKTIKTSLFKSLDPEAFLDGHKHQNLDIYHCYLLQALNHPKMREFTCHQLDKLFKQNLQDKEHLPLGMISSVLNACSSTSGSSTGSSVGSASLTNNSQLMNSSSNSLPSLIRSILLGSNQPPQELTLGLNFLLQGTRRKQTALTSTLLLEEVYQSLLSKHSESPLKTFVRKYFDVVLDELQGTTQSMIHTHSHFYTGNSHPCTAIYLETATVLNFGKYGRCLNCKKEAHHYSKDDNLPVCSLECKHRIQDLMQGCKSNEGFDVLGWLVDCLPTGDGIVFDLLAREIKHARGQQSLKYQQVVTILETSIQHLHTPCLAKPLLEVFILLTAHTQEFISETLPPFYTHVYLLEILFYLEAAPVTKDNLQYIVSLGELLQTVSNMEHLFLQYDCRLFQRDIVTQIIEILSVYAKQYSVAVQILHRILNNVSQVKVHKKKPERYQLDIAIQEEIKLKKELKKIIPLFNQKPKRAIEAIAKLFTKSEEEIVLHEVISRTELYQGSQNQQVHQVQQVQQVHQVQQVQQPSPSVQLALQPQHSPSVKLAPQPVGSVGISARKPPQVYRPSCCFTAKHIALFIRQHLELCSESNLLEPVFEKVKVGEYLGLDDPQAQAVSLEFLRLIDFRGLELDDCLRIVLNIFSLPKESQQIQRIFGALSTCLLPLFPQFKSQTAIFQYLYILLMVQTNQNPNVQDKDRLKLADYLSMCKYVEGGVGVEKATKDFHRIVQSPLDQKIRYKGDQIFHKKYPNVNVQVKEIVTQASDKSAKEREKVIEVSEVKQEIKLKDQKAQQKLKEGELSEFGDISCSIDANGAALGRELLLSIYSSLLQSLTVNSNNLGLYQCIILYGRYGCLNHQQAFFLSLQKLSETPKFGEECSQQLVSIATHYGNYLYTWDHIIRIIYRQEYQEAHSTDIDKLMTNSMLLHPHRLMDFVKALLLFSTAELKTDVEYNRELFVLRHITEIMEYNLARMDKLWQILWPVISGYFKEICLHFRKDIAMAAIDTYKQLSIKLFTLHEQGHEGHEDEHERSFKKQSPHEWSPQKIALKQQGVEKQEDSPIRSMGMLSQHAAPKPILRRNAHGSILETYVYVFERCPVELKDLIINILLNIISPDLMSGWQFIYTILELSDSTDKPLIIRIFTRLLREVTLARLSSHRQLHSICLKELRTSSDYPEIIEGLLQTIWEISEYIGEWEVWLCTLQCIKDIYKITMNSNLLALFFRIANRCSDTVAVSKEIYSEVVDLLVYFIDPAIASVKAKTIILHDLLRAFSTLSLEFTIRYLGGSYGFLSIFQMYLNSPNKILFVFFLRDYFLEQLLPALRGNERQQLEQWVMNMYYDSLPMDIFNMKETDPDFGIGLEEIVRQEGLSGKESDLVEFHLSSREYYEKSVLHLAMLQIVASIYERSESGSLTKLEEAVVDSYSYAFKVNRLLVLRNFLWNNQFIAALDTEETALPGLHKQEHRTLAVILRHMHISTAVPHIVQLLKYYIKMHGLRDVLEKMINEADNKKGGEDDKHNHKKLFLYLKDTEQWIAGSEQNVQLAMGRVGRWREQYPEVPQKTVSPLISVELLQQIYECSLQILQLREISQPIVSATVRLMKLIYACVL